VRISKRNLFLTLAVAALMSRAASAGIIDYDTNGSTLSCNGLAGCTQDTATSVTILGLTLTYNPGSGSSVATPSIINLGNIATTGTGTAVSVAGLLLTINVDSTPPGTSGTLPNGGISGSISTNSSNATILFSPNNTTTTYGTLPGVVISGGGEDFFYQVLNPTLGLVDPTDGNPLGQTSIQGDVVETPIGAPEPAPLLYNRCGPHYVGPPPPPHGSLIALSPARDLLPSHGILSRDPAAGTPPASITPYPEPARPLLLSTGIGLCAGVRRFATRRANR
jgi:hypothetical protein